MLKLLSKAGASEYVLLNALVAGFHKVSRQPLQPPPNRARSVRHVVRLRRICRCFRIALSIILARFGD